MRRRFCSLAFGFGMLTAAGCSSSSNSQTALSSAQGVKEPALETTAGLPAGAASGNLKVVAELPAPSNTGNGAESLLSPGDTLSVEIFQVPDLARTVQIDSSGVIGLPLIGNVQAGGKSVGALKVEIERLYGSKYLQSPQVSLFVKESIGQRVTIDGEVNKAGIYPVAAGSSLGQALAQAGGFRPIADPSKVYVFRDSGGQKLVARYDVAQIRLGKRSDPRIYGGDIVVVFTSQTKVAMQNLKEALGLVRMAAPVGF